MILSGGAGTRLRPITHTNAKQLVPIANKPILFYGIEDMAAAGIRDIGIVVGETAPDVMDAVGDGTRFGVSVTYIHQSDPLGLAHCVQISREFLGDDDFVMYLGDNMLQQGLQDFVERFATQRGASAAGGPAAQILLSWVPDPQRFGVAALNENGHVVHLVEKPLDPPSNLALVGVYLFTAAIHVAVESIEPSARGELEITDAIQWLIDNDHTVLHEVLQGWWLDTGKKDPLLEANRRVLEGMERSVAGDIDEHSEIDGIVVVHPSAKVSNSHIRGPVIIGADASIVDSYIGPFTAIAEGCEIASSEIENSVILEEAKILGVPRMVDSLIGRHAIVTRTKKRPRAARLLIGDHCSIDLD